MRAANLLAMFKSSTSDGCRVALECSRMWRTFALKYHRFAANWTQTFVCVWFLRLSGGDLQFVRCVSVSDDSGRGGRFIFSCGEGEKRDIMSLAGVGELSETKDTFTFKQPTSALPGIRQDCGEAARVDPVAATQQAAAGDEGGCCVMSVKLNELCGFSVTVKTSSSQSRSCCSERVFGGTN